jgi:plasmid stability protein
MPAAVTIRQLDDSVKARLRVQAAQHGRSMEEEAREILKAALETKPAERLNLAESIRRRFAPLGGVELKLPQRELIRESPDFSK